LLVEKQGGLCYENCELAYYALEALGFDVHRMPVYCTYFEPYYVGSAKKSTHNILVVNIDGKQYLVDIGFGYNSLRYPIEFIPETT
jgi:N-hydroxyarylamine O-acetyltransferase